MKNFFCKKKNIATLAILCLIIFSWAGTLDRYSDEYTSDAIVKAGSVYAVTRGINAVVSMLQSTTIDVGIGVGGAITVGEILDPVNDLIERFSQVMTVVLSSLVLQKILLVIAANKIFSILLTLLGLCSVPMILKKKTGSFSIILKLFILLVVVRFSLSFAVLSNSVVDHMFLSTHIEESSSKLNEFQASVRSIQSETAFSEAELAKKQKSIRDDIIRLENLRTKEIPTLLKALNLINRKLSQANSELTKKNMSWRGKLKPFTDNPNINQAQATVLRFKKEKNAMENQIKEKKLLVQELIENINLKEAELTGDAEGIVAKLKSIKRNLSPNVIEAKVSAAVNDILRLLILFILTTILIPLMFFYLFISLVKGVWRMQWEQVVDYNK